MTKHKYQNKIADYRERMHLNTGAVAHLLGHRDASTLTAYERGQRLPSLENALRLSVILRVPVEFLFGQIYDELRNSVRAQEERASELAAPLTTSNHQAP